MVCSGNKTHRLAFVCTRPRALAWCDVVHFFMPFSLAHTGVLMARLGVDARFGFMPQPRLRGVLAQTDVYVHASDMEAEAMSCMEAFATGLVPIIASSPLSATPQFALDDRSLFAAGDPQDLARHLDWWIEHPRERERMGHAYAREAEGYRIGAHVVRMRHWGSFTTSDGYDYLHLGRGRPPDTGRFAWCWTSRRGLRPGWSWACMPPAARTSRPCAAASCGWRVPCPCRPATSRPRASLCATCRSALPFRMPCRRGVVRPI